jgi:hypothetical protein
VKTWTGKRRILCENPGCPRERRSVSGLHCDACRKRVERTGQLTLERRTTKR